MAEISPLRRRMIDDMMIHKGVALLLGQIEAAAFGVIELHPLRGLARIGV